MQFSSDTNLFHLCFIMHLNDMLVICPEFYPICSSFPMDQSESDEILCLDLQCFPEQNNILKC